MITPAFELTQNEKFLIANIQVPFAKISDVEIEFDDADFMFYSKPYFLRLNLPGKVIYEEEPSIKYDFEKRIFIIHMPKAQEGEIFQNLDLLTKLLEPKNRNIKAAPLIEVIEGAASEDSNEEEEESQWNIEQSPSSEEFGVLNISGQQCGFGNKYSFAIFNLEEETEEIFDVKKPQNKSLSARKAERLDKEAEDFDEDHYIADLYEDDAIQHVLKYQPKWEIMYEKQQSEPSFCVDEKISFTSEEKDRLLKLPNKEYILDKNEKNKVFLSLIEILFAYVYNKRITEEENTVESAWTINKLSATLSWLESFNSVTEVAQTCIRRSLCYPLFRHFELSVTALEDVRKILLLGRKYIIKCLLEMHEMFNLSEPRYILNDLYITDYCVWMQTKKCSSKRLEPYAKDLEKMLLTKGDVGLNLVDVESFAAVAWMSQASPGSSNTPVIPKNTANSSSQTSKTPVKEITTNLEKLSINISSKRSTENDNSSESTDSDESISNSSSCSEFELCNPCSSDSSGSSSSSFDSLESSDSDINSCEVYKIHEYF